MYAFSCELLSFIYIFLLPLLFFLQFKAIGNHCAAIRDLLECWIDFRAKLQPLVSGHAQGMPFYSWQRTDRWQPGKTDHWEVIGMRPMASRQPSLSFWHSNINTQTLTSIQACCVALPLLGKWITEQSMCGCDSGQWPGGNNNNNNYLLYIIYHISYIYIYISENYKFKLWILSCFPG